ncbi:MAG: tyrosine-protein phosphatase [Streptomycetaceae bacterium]|nr:tyrosine-protein phosphatase [Streptomycetaceae bacterium]
MTVATAAPAGASDTLAAPGGGAASGISAPQVTDGGADGTYTVSWTTERPRTVRVWASTDPRDPSRTGTLVAAVAHGDTATVTLDPSRRWFFELATAPGKGAHGVIAATRQVTLQGAVNTRDLGGFTTRDGRAVRWGLLYRSDALGKLTDADLPRLAALNLRTVVDFRGTQEIAHDGADRVPAGVAVVNTPVLDASGDAFTEAVTQAIATGDNAKLREVLGDGKATQMMIQGGHSIVSGPAARAGFAEALRRVADTGQVPLLFHCTAGKDRTGWMSALLLTVAGVPQDAVMADYLASNDYRRALNEGLYAYLRTRGIDPELLRPVMEQSPAYLQASFDEITARYGSLTGYLRDGLGLDARTIARLRNVLVTS